MRSVSTRAIASRAGDAALPRRSWKEGPPPSLRRKRRGTRYVARSRRREAGAGQALSCSEGGLVGEAPKTSRSGRNCSGTPLESPSANLTGVNMRERGVSREAASEAGRPAAKASPIRCGGRPALKALQRLGLPAGRSRANGCGEPGDSSRSLGPPALCGPSGPLPLPAPGLSTACATHTAQLVGCLVRGH